MTMDINQSVFLVVLSIIFKKKLIKRQIMTVKRKDIILPPTEIMFITF